jgi:hypothetical protein
MRQLKLTYFSPEVIKHCFEQFPDSSCSLDDEFLHMIEENVHDEAVMGK